jgi:hypothetical protein
LGFSRAIVGQTYVLSFHDIMSTAGREPFFDNAPDPDFRLPEDVRRSIAPYVDAEAVQELIAWTRPEHREEMLADQLEIVELLKTHKVAFSPPAPTRNPHVDALLRRILRIDPPGS